MSLIKNSFISSVKKRAASYEKEQLAIGLAAASIFMPFIITCITLIAVVVWALANKNTRAKMFADKSNLPIYIFSVLLLFVPLFYLRYISALAGMGFLITLLFFLLAKSAMTRPFYDALMDICCFASIIPFLYSLVQKLVMGIGYRTTGGMLNANYYGTICEIVIIIAAYRLLTSPKSKAIYYSIIAMNVAGIFLCDCQSAWIAVMVGVIGLLFFCGRKKQGVLVLIISIVLVAIGLFTPGLLPRMEVMPQTFSTRKNIWMTAIEGIKAHFLFGQGTLTYLFTYQLYDGYKTYHAHSLYLDPLLSYGIVGVGVMLSYVILLFRRIYLNIKQSFNREVMAVVLAVIFAVCVHGITDITILWVQTGMLLFLVLSGIFIKPENKC